MIAFDLIKSLKQIKKKILLRTSEPISELPYNIRTRVQPYYAAGFGGEKSREEEEKNKLAFRDLNSLSLCKKTMVLILDGNYAVHS